MLERDCLNIRIQQEKSNQNDQFLILVFEKVLKMQASVIGELASSIKKE